MDDAIQSTTLEPLHTALLERFTLIALDVTPTKLHRGVTVLYVATDVWFDQEDLGFTAYAGNLYRRSLGSLTIYADDHAVLEGHAESVCWYRTRSIENTRCSVS